MLALHALQSNGYSVLDAENGEQALRVVQTFGVPISLFLTDVVMPKMGGRELAERLLLNQPSIKVLYMSGYADDSVIRHRVACDRTHFLEKPFSTSRLTGMVREILDRPDRE